MPSPTGPNAVRKLLAKRHPGLDVVKRGSCWYITGPGTDHLYSTSLNTFRLDGPPEFWLGVIIATLDPITEAATA